MATEKQIEHNRAIARAGGLARAKQFTTEYQKFARSCQPRDSLVKRGKKGFVVAMHNAGFKDTKFMRSNAHYLDDNEDIAF